MDVDGDGDFDCGVVIIFVVDLIVFFYIDCSGLVIYSVNRVGEQFGCDKMFIILICEDLGVVLFEVYVWDSVDNFFQVQFDGSIGGFNYDYCEMYVLVINNLADCNVLLFIIVGVIEWEDEFLVLGVFVDFSGFISQFVFIDSMGGYVFEGLELEFDYIVIFFFDGDDQNGLIIYDVVLISWYILGIDYLDFFYQLIVVDVNNLGFVSIFDIILLCQVILSIFVEIFNGLSWWFVLKSYQFEDLVDFWIELILYLVIYNDLVVFWFEEDYVVIKIGDIDLSVVVSVVGLVIEIRSRYDGLVVIFYFEDVIFFVGIVVEVFLNSDWFGLVGCQVFLIFDQEVVILENVVFGMLGELFFYQVFCCLVMSWNGDILFENDIFLFYLIL